MWSMKYRTILSTSRPVTWVTQVFLADSRSAVLESLRIPATRNKTEAPLTVQSYFTVRFSSTLRTFSWNLTIDVNMAVFSCPRVAWQFQTPICFQAVKQGLILEQEVEKAHIWMSSMSGTNWCRLFHKDVKSWDSSTWFRIWNYQTPAEKKYLHMHLLAERFVFWVVMIGVF